VELPPPLASGDSYGTDLGCIFDEIAKKGPTYSNPDYYLDVSLVRFGGTIVTTSRFYWKPAKGEGNGGKFVRVGLLICHVI